MCKCERGLKFEMEHAREATWTQHKISTIIDQARRNIKQEIYLLGLLFVGKKTVSLQSSFSFGVKPRPSFYSCSQRYLAHNLITSTPNKTRIRPSRPRAWPRSGGNLLWLNKK